MERRHAGVRHEKWSSSCPCLSVQASHTAATNSLTVYTGTEDACYQAVPLGLKFHFRSRHLQPFFFLVCVSCGKSEEKKNPWSIFQGCIWKGKNRPLLCWTNTPDIGAFRTPTQAGFQSLRLGLPGSTELVEGTSEAQRDTATWVEEFALGSRLGICEFSTSSTSRHVALTLSCASSPTLCGFFFLGWSRREPWASGDPFPAPT